MNVILNRSQVRRTTSELALLLHIHGRKLSRGRFTSIVTPSARLPLSQVSSGLDLESITTRSSQPQLREGCWSIGFSTSSCPKTLHSM
ncbi:hypothetical protein TNCV_2031661 [Trichonephila clavipes]|nr:hypothetical protein TNCV_2031661 [Trichonephila clavipes]